jgi:Leucine-rich repeat (LRR) protein
LEVLDLSENDLLEFPKSFGKLKNLKKLYLRDFGTAETLPLSFENLEELTLNGKNLDYTEVLSDISKLKSLKKLNIIELRNEKKFHIPKEFADLNNLEELCLYHSEGMKDLTQMFDIISKLKNLTSLNMTFYEWGLKEKVPASIADFKKLHTIDKLSVRDLPQNLLSELFTYLSNIKTLKKINAHQGINYLPPEIGLLTSLEELQLSTTNIKSYPKELLSLTQLKKLDLRGCGLSSADKQFIKKTLKETDVRL